MQNTNNKNKLRWSLVLILLAFFDGLFAQPFYGIQWQSPAAMLELAESYRYVKVIMVIIGFILFFQVRKHVTQLLPTRWQQQAAKVAIYIGFITQITVLPYIIVMNLLFGAPPMTTFEHRVGDNTFYVQNVAATKNSKAYHYVYFKCTKTFGFYSLSLIDRYDWLGKVYPAIDNNILTINNDTPRYISEPRVFTDIKASCD